MPDPFPNMRDILKPSRCGAYAIEHFSLTEDEALRANVIAAVGNPHYDEEEVEAGDYVRLVMPDELPANQVLMSDMGCERRTNLEVVERSKGQVIIGGLGIGMIIGPIYGKPEVERITVVERSADVIALVVPSLRKYLNATYPQYVGTDRLRVVKRDVHKYEPPKGAKADVIYMDIWNTPSCDAYLEMVALKQRYNKWLAPSGWFECWRSAAAKADHEEYESLEYRDAEPAWATKLRRAGK